MNLEETQRFARELFEVDTVESEATRKGRPEQAVQIVKLWTSSPTVAPILGQTRWAAYNAVSEWADHAAPIRGAKGHDDIAIPSPLIQLL